MTNNQERDDQTVFPEDDSAEQVAEVKSASSLDLDQNIASLLTYLGWFITGIIFIFIEKENKFVRFHAFQSTFTFAAILSIQIVLAIVAAIFALIPAIGWLIALLILIVQFVIGFATFALWIFLMVKAYGNNKVSLPFVGKMAEKQVNK